MADVFESIGDPGRRWRRMVRVGAVLCTLATIMPCEGFSPTFSVWGYSSIYLNEMLSGEMLTPSISIYNCLIFTILLAGPILLITTSPNYFTSTLRKNATRILLILHWAFATFPPYYAAWRIFQKLKFQETGIALSIIGLSIFLLISALAMLASRRVWRTSLFPFGMGVPAAALLCVAWSVAAAGCIKMVLEFGSVIISFQIIALDGTGLVGSFLVLIGWLKWWSSVRAALRAKSHAPATTAVPEPMQS